MSRVDWTASAVADLENIKIYLDEFAPELSERSISALVLATRWLLDNPGAGPRIGYRGWRKWKPRGQRHLLIYEPTSSGITVVRVHHERSDWPAVSE